MGDDARNRGVEGKWSTSTPGHLENDDALEGIPGQEGRAETYGGTRDDDLRDISTDALGGSTASGDLDSGDYEGILTDAILGISDERINKDTLDSVDADDADDPPDVTDPDLDRNADRP